MACLQQKQNRWKLYVYLVSPLLILWVTAVQAEILDYDRDRDVDISMGTFNYFFNKNDIELEKIQGGSLPEIGTGIFVGGYISSRNRLLAFFFKTDKLYTIYEAGLAINYINNEDSYILSFPLTADLAYKIPLSRKLALFPYAGTGFDFIRSENNDEATWQLYYLIETGFEVKYSLWSNTKLKMRATYGVLFIDQVESGYMHFLKIRFPIPFIP